MAYESFFQYEDEDKIARLVQENVTPLLMRWSYVFLALTH